MNWTTLVIMAVVFLIGCFGGLVNWVFFSPEPREKESNEPREKESKYRLWYLTKDCETRFPGLATTVPLGGIAALIFWCLNGPYSGTVLIGPHGPHEGLVMPTLTVGQIPTSFLIGLGGATYILTEAQRRCAQNTLSQQSGSR